MFMSFMAMIMRVLVLMLMRGHGRDIVQMRLKLYTLLLQLALDC